MAVELERMDTGEVIPPRYGVIGVVVTAVFFQIINQIVGKVGPPSKVDKSDTWKWRNLFISWIHAIIVGSWDLSCFVIYPDLMSDLIAYKNGYLYAMIAFSSGYFVHDFIDLAVNGKLLSSWEIIAHHIAVAGMFIYNLLTSLCISYNVIALLCEVNTIFLHSRKLLQMCKFGFSHWLYQAASQLNLVTFVCCRFVALAWIVHGMFVYSDRVSVYYFYSILCSMLIMWPINVILFWRLLKNDILRPQSKKTLTNGHHHSNGDLHGNNNKVLLNGENKSL